MPIKTLINAINSNSTYDICRARVCMYYKECVCVRACVYVRVRVRVRVCARWRWYQKIISAKKIIFQSFSEGLGRWYQKIISTKKIIFEFFGKGLDGDERNLVCYPCSRRKKFLFKKNFAPVFLLLLDGCWWTKKKIFCSKNKFYPRLLAPPWCIPDDQEKKFLFKK